MIPGEEAFVQGKRSLGPPWPNGGGLEESFGLNESGLVVPCAEGLIGLEEKRKPNGRTGGSEGGLEDDMVKHKLEGVREHDKCEEVGKCDEDKLSDLGFILEEENVTVDNVLAVGMSCDENFSVNPRVEEAGSGATVGGGGSVLCLAACSNRPNSKGGHRGKRQRSVI
ncbi:hypothetical protein GUJ93_ZPchr0014g47474 [Zizania palustris]|uniref:Uncharacterized protein n=1 Tax=Zizania palustris TaxID=103762 RepID=A0A8J5TKS1_ZIZPA|nr:hypothetical protein GUJ93_ZPchr0014g47474 [Zizania palustris]